MMRTATRRRGLTGRVTALVWLCPVLAFGVMPGTARTQSPKPAPYPIDLPTALRLADAQNLDVQIARERIKVAEAHRTSAMEQFLPWLAPGVAFRRRDGVAQASPSGIIGKAAFQSYQPGLSATAQIALGDAIYNSLAARQLVKASGEALDAQRQAAALRAAEGYFDLVKANALVEVVRAALATSQDYQQQLHEAVTIGIAFRGDELRVQSQTERYQVVLRQAVAQRRIAAVDLARVLHLDPAVELAPRDAELVPLTLIDTASVADSLVTQAMRSRPELRQTEALLAASRASRNAALYGPLIPAFGAQLFTGSLGGGPDSGHSKTAAMTDYTIGVSWRIGAGGLFDIGRMNATASQLATAQLGESKLRDAVAAEVLTGLTRVRSLAEQIALSARALETANATLALTRARKEFGVGLVLEDLQAQQAVTQARSDYVTAIAEFDKAQYGLRRAVGRSTPEGTPR
jgi:outer membrane protein TolC